MSSPSAIRKPDTPPSSDFERPHQLPPSPPLSPKKHPARSTVDRLIGAIRLRRSGRSQCEDDWEVFRLTRAEHTEFEQRLAANEALCRWFDDKVKHDWEPEEGGFILRMPSAIHERFRVQVETTILAAVKGWDGDAAIATHLQQIYLGGSTTLTLYAPKLDNSSQESEEAEVTVRRSPDATYFHPDQSDLPGLVVEVSYAQQRKDLPRLAESYIVDSRHAIRCVIGFDISYPTKGKKVTNKEATVSVWRPGVEKNEAGEEVGRCVCEVDATPFQSSTGSLELKISDLLPLTTFKSLPESDAKHTTLLNIPFSDLSAFLTEAHDWEARASSQAKMTPASDAPTRFRKRKRTPSEELSDTREEKFVRREEEEARKEKRVDGAWAGRTTRRSGGGVEFPEASAGVDEVEGRRRSLRKRRSSGRGVGEGS